jgi:dipeptidyl aminopeptidase/acylaminoacyl peptidase
VLSRRATAAFLAASLYVGVAQAAPLEAYGRLPAISEVALSSDGERLAFVAEVQDKRRVVAFDLKTGKTLAGATVGGAKVRGVRWAGDQSVIVMTSTAASLHTYGVDLAEWDLPQLLDLKTGQVSMLVKSQRRMVGGALHSPVIREFPDRAVAYVDSAVDNGEIQIAMFSVDLTSGKTSMSYTVSPNVRDWVLSPEGEPVGRGLFDGDTGKFRIELGKGRAWKTIYRDENSIGRTRLVGLGRDGVKFLVSQGDADGRAALAELDAAGTLTPLKAPPDASQIFFNRRTQALAALGYGGDDPRYAFYDRTLAERWSAILGLFPETRLQLVDFDAEMKRLLVYVEADHNAGSYHVVDFRGEAPKALGVGSAYPGLKPDDLSEVRRVAFKATDGLELDGYLTLPNGRSPKALPLIVLPHGGPESHDEPGFDWWSQALASRGYAVLRVNFRGSDNKDAAFRNAGFGEWGGKMQTDLSDGVRHLANQGLIDPKRVCIMGASYGGYAALAGPTLDPGVYRCAVSVSGVSDLKGMLAEERADGNKAGVRYWRKFMGVDEDPSLAVQRSPLRLAKQVDAPILLLHGLDDSVVPFEQSKRMADALKAAGKPHRFVPLHNEDHWLSREDTRQRMLAEAVAFVEQYNPPN